MAGCPRRQPAGPQAPRGGVQPTSAVPSTSTRLLVREPEPVAPARVAPNDGAGHVGQPAGHRQALGQPPKRPVIHGPVRRRFARHPGVPPLMRVLIHTPSRAAGHGSCGEEGGGRRRTSSTPFLLLAFSCGCAVVGAEGGRVCGEGPHGVAAVDGPMVAAAGQVGIGAVALHAQGVARSHGPQRREPDRPQPRPCETRRPRGSSHG